MRPSIIWTFPVLRKNFSGNPWFPSKKVSPEPGGGCGISRHMESSVLIILSNGHSKFILGPAAVEVHKRGLLSGFITGGYPTARVRRSVHFLKLDIVAPVKRLLQRLENLPD